MNNDNKYLYIPLEIFIRELKGMLLFSLVAAKYGWRVVIGGKQSIFPVLDKLPLGVVLLKSIVPGEMELQKKIASYGHKIASLDAEGLLPSNGKSGVELRYSQDTIELSDILFFWGKEQFESVERVFPDIKKNACITGSPIFDYWRFLKSSYHYSGSKNQKTILIATSFPFANHIIGNEVAYLSVKNASGPDAAHEHLDEIFLDAKVQEIIYPKFIKLVKKIIEKNPASKILIRPHPSENPNIWKKIANKFPNTELQIGGEVSQQIILCDIFIHFNSTTSIEASYLGKKVITYLPKMEPHLQARMNRHALEVSYICNSFDEVLLEIDNSSEKNKFLPENLDRIIHGFKSKKIPYCSLLIVKALNKLDIQSSQSKFPSKFKLSLAPSSIKLRIRRRTVWMIGWIDYLTRVFCGKYKHRRSYYKYGKSKQGELDMLEIQNTLSNMATSLRMKSSDYSFKIISKKLFLISPEVIKK
jgi:surface carbohydrate biosynthesis protein